jgi:hypothetical protein
VEVQVEVEAKVEKKTEKGTGCVVQIVSQTSAGERAGGMVGSYPFQIVDFGFWIAESRPERVKPF